MKTRQTQAQAQVQNEYIFLVCAGAGAGEPICIAVKFSSVYLYAAKILHYNLNQSASITNHQSHLMCSPVYVVLL